MKGEKVIAQKTRQTPTWTCQIDCLNEFSLSEPILENKPNYWVQSRLAEARGGWEVLHLWGEVFTTRKAGGAHSFPDSYVCAVESTKAQGRAESSQTKGHRVNAF